MLDHRTNVESESSAGENTAHYRKHNLLHQWHETVLHANEIDLVASD